MASKFAVNFESDSDEQETIKATRNDPFQRQKKQLFGSNSVVLTSETNSKDKYVSKISKNNFFGLEDYEFNNEKSIAQNKSQVLGDPAKMQNSPAKKTDLRRKKVSTSIKLAPLKDTQLKKASQTVQIYNPSSKISTITGNKMKQSLEKPIFSQSTDNLKKTYCQKHLNFQMESDSSSEEQITQKVNDANLNKINFKKPSSSKQTAIFFDEQQEQAIRENILKQTKAQLDEQKKRKITRKVSKVQQNQNINQTKASKPNESAIEPKKQEDQNKSELEQRKARVNIQNEPNPQKQPSSMNKITLSQIQNSQSRLKSISEFQEKKLSLQRISNFLLTPLDKNNVLNLTIKRKKSLLNFFSPEFRVEFAQDQYFVMASKKTSSKPTSTFTFSSGQDKFQETSIHYLGKMKSNLVGSVLNIFGPGRNPSCAQEIKIIPREMIATIVFKTQMFGTGKPRQFTVFMKKPEVKYYQDLRGVKMYVDEIPLNELYYGFQQNTDKIQIFTNRKPTYHAESQEYVMNFEGKVKKSSIKNFILEDPQNQNAKVLLFGKSNEDEFILDIYSPLSPVVGVAIALSSFDSRLGSD